MSDVSRTVDTDTFERMVSYVRAGVMWIEQPVVTRLLMAQLREVEQLVRIGEEDRAAAVLNAVALGIRAGGAELWSGSPEVS